MASKPAAQLSAPEKEQLAVSYAAFVLSSSGADVTADAVKRVLEAAKITASESLIKAFAKTLAGKKANVFIGSAGGSGSAPAATTPAPAGKPEKADNKKPAEAKKTAPPPPPAEEEEEMDMGGMFDD